MGQGHPHGSAGGRRGGQGRRGGKEEEEGGEEKEGEGEEGSKKRKKMKMRRTRRTKCFLLQKFPNTAIAFWKNLPVARDSNI